jgi:hypothetical protein
VLHLDVEVHRNGRGVDLMTIVIGALVEMSVGLCFCLCRPLFFDPRCLLLFRFDRYFFLGDLKGIGLRKVSFRGEVELSKLFFDPQILIFFGKGLNLAVK